MTTLLWLVEHFKPLLEYFRWVPAFWTTVTTLLTLKLVSTLRSLGRQKRYKERQISLKEAAEKAHRAPNVQVYIKEAKGNPPRTILGKLLHVMSHTVFKVRNFQIIITDANELEEHFRIPLHIGHHVPPPEGYYRLILRPDCVIFHLLDDPGGCHVIHTFQLPIS